MEEEHDRLFFLRRSPILKEADVLVLVEVGVGGGIHWTGPFPVD